MVQVMSNDELPKYGGIGVRVGPEFPGKRTGQNVGPGAVVEFRGNISPTIKSDLVLGVHYFVGRARARYAAVHAHRRQHVQYPVVRAL